MSAYPRKNPLSDFYIGIASGRDAFTAMKARRTGDDYKEMHGINRMTAVFKSKDQKICKKREKELVAVFKKHPRNLNRIGGGGGRSTKQPWSYVYLAMHV